MTLHFESLEERVVLDHSHVPIDFIGGKIVVAPSSSGLVFRGEVDTEGGGFSLDPSITDMDDAFGTPSHLLPGSTISYTVLGPLLVHNGTSFVAAGSEFVHFVIPNGANVTGTSGILGPYAYGTVASDSSMHVHPLVQVFSTTTAAIGIQVELSTNAPGIAKSDPFWLVYNYDLLAPAFDNAISAFANLSPSITAEAGGPYAGTEGSPVALTGSGTGTISTFAWDFDNDGQYDDAVGQNVAFSATDNGVYTVGLRVTGPGGTATDTSTVTIANVAPAVAVTGPSTGVRGQPRTFTLSASDPSAVDQAATFTFEIDWDGNGTVDQTLVGLSGVSVEHVFATSSVYNVRVRATDKDAGTSTFVNKGVTITDWALQTDETNPQKTNLVWGGTNGADGFAFAGGFVFTQVLNNQFFGTPIVTFVGSYNGKLIAYGQGSTDLLFADVSNLPVLFFGGDGDDVLVSGRGADTLYGGNGNDMLFGGTLDSDGSDLLFGEAGNDLLVGHYGADTLYGGSGNDLLITGRVVFGSSLSSAAFAIQSEWVSPRTIGQKVANISGTGTPARNNQDFFLTAGSTVVDDGAIDRVFGESDDDWILYDFSEDIAPDATGSDITTNIG